MQKGLLRLFYPALIATIACLPQTGTVDIKSIPSGADIFLDDSLTGKKTDCILEDVPFDHHKLTLVLKDYVDWTQEFELNAETPSFDTTVELIKGNNQPVITSVSASVNPLKTGHTAFIQAAAEDSDADSLTFEWASVDEDTVYLGQSFTWKAPWDPKEYLFCLAVSDGKGGVAYDSLVLTVEKDTLKPVILLSATDVTIRQLTLTWTASTYSKWYSYEIYRSVAPDTTIGSVAEAIFKQTDTAWTDVSVSPGTGYYYVVAVVDSENNRVYSNKLFAATDSISGTQNLDGGHGLRLANTGDYIFCAAREKSVRGFQVFTDGLIPGTVIRTPRANPDAYAYDLYLPANLLHVAFGKEGYHAYSVSDPYSPEEVISIDAATLGGEARAVFNLGSAIFIGCTNPATSTSTIVYFDYNSDTNLYIDTIYDIPENIFVVKNCIYVSEGNAGVQILNWNPAADDPVQHASIFTTPDTAYNVYVSDQYAYIAAGTQGFIVVDITNPQKPTQVASWVGDKGSDTRGFYFLGSTAYLADGVCGLRVLDISNPANPTLISKKKIGTLITDTWVRSYLGKVQVVLSDWNNAIYMIEL